MTYQTSVPVVWDSYPSTSYGDDLAIAALWLGWAQNNLTLISQAKGYFDYFELDKQLPDSVFNWDSLLPGVPILGTQICRSYPQLGEGGWQSLAETYLDRLVSGKGAGKLTKGSRTRFPGVFHRRNYTGGLLYYNNAPSSTILNLAINAAMLLRRYAAIASDDKTDTYLVMDFSSVKVKSTHSRGLEILEGPD